MRIAMMTDSYFPTRDGVVTSIEATRKALEAKGHEVVIIAPDPGKRDRIDGIHYLPARKFKSYEGYFVPIYPSDKISLLRSLDVDVIHVHGIALMAIKAMSAAVALKIPLVITFHTMVCDTLEYYSPVPIPAPILERLAWIYLRSLLKRADGIIAPTASTASELKRNGVVAREMRIVPTGIDMRRFSPNGDGQRIKKMYDIDGKVAVHVGRMSYEKNIDVIVRAVADIDGLTLMIVGKGPAKDDLEKLVKELGMDDRVVFTGFVPDDDLPEYYAAADVAVSASKFETQGLSVLEAMACGIPVACTKDRAFEDIIVDGENGVFFEGGARECAAAIMRCISAGNGLRTGARRTAEAFSSDASADAHIALYNDVIAAKAKRLGGR